jgi:outer membrane protein OmpA-like peptidoglycan-associated protein
MLASGLVVWSGIDLAAQERPSPAQILNALKPTTKTRALTAQSPQAAEDQRFIDSLRSVKTRSLTSGERQKVAEIAKTKPKIDLEIYFNYNSAEITPKAVPDLMNLGQALSDPELRGSVFVLSGHTDAKGSEAYNQGLSERRAQAVKQYLLQKFRLPEDSLVTAGYGEEQLKDPANPFAAENRRVQIVNLEATQKAGR